MKIAFLFESLNKWGGAERAVSVLMNALADRNFEITLYTFDHDDVQSHYPLRKSIQWKKLGPKEKPKISQIMRLFPSRFLKRHFMLKRQLKLDQPKVLISFINFTNLLCCFTGLRTRIPTVISERSNPRMKKLTWFWSCVREIVYPWSSAFVLQSNGVKGCYSKRVQKNAPIGRSYVLF